MKRSLILSCVSLVALTTITTARAQSSNAVLAEALFRDATTLFNDGKIVEACAKFDESWKLDPAAGTLYNLAQCREKEGRIATAWTHYSELAGRAAQAGQADKEARMRAKINELAPRLPKVTLDLQGRYEITDVKVDGQSVGRAAWSSELPLDPGDHVFAFSGPDKIPTERRLRLAEGQEVVLKIDALAGAAAPPPPAAVSVTPSAVQDGGASSRKTLGWVLGGAGVAGLAVGTIFGIVATGQKSDADELFDKRDSGFKSKEDAARTSAVVSTIGFGVGIVGIGAGVYFLLTTGTSKKAAAGGSRVWAAPRFEPTGGGLDVGARF